MDLNKLEIEVTREIHKRSYYEFFKEAFAQLHPEEPYDENWHAEFLCGELQAEFERIKIHRRPREKDIVINMPFRAAKSLITTVIFPVWCWAQDPKTKFICVSYAEGLALEHADLSRELIKSTWFQKYYGELVALKSGAVSFYKTEAGGFRKSVGTGGQITGSGADIIIVDDPQNPKLAVSEKERENVQRFHDHTLYSRLNQLDMGVRIIVMQRLHQKDLSGHVLEESPESYHHICIPANIESQKDKDLVSPKHLLSKYVDNLFWPTRFSRPILKDYNKRLGEVQAAGQLQQRPAPAEGNLLKREWFRIVQPEVLNRNIANEPVIFFMDTSYTEKQENDPNGILAAFKRDNVVYITNAHIFYAEFPKLVGFVPPYVNQQGYTGQSKIYVEPKASGKSLTQQLKFATKLNVIEIEGDFLKDDKLTRLSAISPMIEAGRVVLLDGNWNEKFLDEVTMFPNAEHDELVDLLVYAVQTLIPTNEFFWGFL